MNFKKTWKRFFSLSRRSDGFTLVELIVVIAILAILAGVGVPAYNGYIKKANMGADQTLVAEVKHALELHYYANPTTFKGGVVVLSVDNAPEAEGMEAALEKVFGDSWKELRLKYDGWSGKFQNSGFYGDANGLNDLVTTVDSLTSALGSALDIVGGGEEFNAYMNNLNATTNDEKANAAVFYVANKTSKLNPEQMSTAIKNMGSANTPEAALKEMNKTFESSLASAAALYALAEGFSRYYDETNPGATGETPSKILNDATTKISQDAQNGEIKDALGAYTTLFGAFGNMMSKHGESINTYFNDRMMQDFEAYADVLKTVSAAEGAIIDKQPLSTSGYFTTEAVKNLLNNYAEGGVFVYAVVNADGSVTVSDSITAEE